MQTHGNYPFKNLVTSQFLTFEKMCKNHAVTLPAELIYSSAGHHMTSTTNHVAQYSSDTAVVPSTLTIHQAQPSILTLFTFRSLSEPFIRGRKISCVL